MLEARTTPEGSQSEPAVRGRGWEGVWGEGRGRFGQWEAGKRVTNRCSGLEWDLLAVANGGSGSMWPIRDQGLSGICWLWPIVG